MKKIATLLTTTAISLLLAACATTEKAPPSMGPNMPAAQPSKSTLTELRLQKNKTTKEQIIAVFGSPNIITPRDDETSVWIYQRVKNLTGTTDKKGDFLLRKLPATDKEKAMTIILHFDKRGIVERYKGLLTSL